MISPFVPLIIAYSVAILLYLLNFSSLFPPLSSNLIFILLMLIVFGVLAHIAFRRVFFKHKMLESTYIAKIKTSSFQVIVGLLYVGILLECVYCRSIPLLGIGGNYVSFGIPTFHVIEMTLASATSVLIFIKMLKCSEHRSLLIALYLLDLFLFLIVVNRGLLVLSIVVSLFAYILQRKAGITRKATVKMFMGLILGLYLFGLVGNARVQGDYNQKSTIADSSIVMRIGGANANFTQSKIPTPFFWTYEYVASPLANLQSTLTHVQPGKPGVNQFEDFFTKVFLWDFISKHISVSSTLFPALISPELNVSTAFVNPYLYLGYIGIYIFGIFLLIFPFLYYRLLYLFAPRYGLLGEAVLCTMYSFLFFINFFTYTALSLQLTFPFILQWVDYLKSRN